MNEGQIVLWAFVGIIVLFPLFLLLGELRPIKQRITVTRKLMRVVRIAKNLSDPELGKKQHALKQNLKENRYLYLFFAIGYTAVFHSFVRILNFGLEGMLSSIKNESIRNFVSKYILEPYLLTVWFGIFAISFYLKLIFEPLKNDG